MARKNLSQEDSLKEEIQRIQTLLRRMDTALAQKEEIPLKELAQAVHTAGDGGKSIAQLRKLARELASAQTDVQYQRAREGLFAMLEKLGEWNEAEED
jgi:hypothetical protein